MFCKYKDFSSFILALKANFKTMPYWLSWCQQMLYKEKKLNDLIQRWTLHAQYLLAWQDVLDCARVE